MFISPSPSLQWPSSHGPACSAPAWAVKGSPSSLSHYILFLVCCLVCGLPLHQNVISKEPRLECCLAYQAPCLTFRGRSVSVCRVSEWMDECNFPLLCQVELGRLLLGSAPNPKSGQFCLHSRNSLKNPGAKSLAAQSTAEHFYCKRGVPGKEGWEQFRGAKQHSETLCSEMRGRSDR